MSSLRQAPNSFFDNCRFSFPFSTHSSTFPLSRLESSLLVNDPTRSRDVIFAPYNIAHSLPFNSVHYLTTLFIRFCTLFCSKLLKLYHHSAHSKLHHHPVMALLLPSTPIFPSFRSHVLFYFIFFVFICFIFLFVTSVRKARSSHLRCDRFTSYLRPATYVTY